MFTEAAAAATVVSGLIGVSALLVRLGQYRERVTSRGEVVAETDASVEDIEAEVSSLSREVRTLQQDVSRMSEGIEVNRQSIDGSQRVFHDLLIDSETCGHPRCPWCEPPARSSTVVVHSDD